jgi:hypothetical protein
MKRLFTFAVAITLCGHGFAAAQSTSISLKASTSLPVVSSGMPVIIKATLSNLIKAQWSPRTPIGFVQGSIIYSIDIKNSSGQIPPASTKKLAVDSGQISTAFSSVTPLVPTSDNDEQLVNVNDDYILAPGIYTLTLGRHVLADQSDDWVYITSNPITIEVKNSARGDFNADGVIDIKDISVIQSALNTPSLSSADLNDGRDLNGDGVIDAVDARLLTTLCTRPRCATQ